MAYFFAKKPLEKPIVSARVDPLVQHQPAAEWFIFILKKIFVHIPVFFVEPRNGITNTKRFMRILFSQKLLNLLLLSLQTKFITMNTFTATA